MGKKEYKLQFRALIKYRVFVVFELLSKGFFSVIDCLYQGDTPKDKAEKAPDPELAAYLGNRQHYQMIQREDQETTV